MFMGLASCLPWPVYSYIIPPRGVLERADRILESARGLTATLSGRALNQTSNTMVPVSEVWRFEPHPEFTVELTGVTNTALGRTDTRPAHLELTPILQKTFAGIFYMSELASCFAALKISTKVHHLGLLQDRPMFVIGAADRHSRASTISIDKESLTIRRIRLNDAMHRYDIRLNLWNRPSTKGVFPNEIIIRRDGRPHRILQTKQVSLRGT